MVLVILENAFLGLFYIIPPYGYSLVVDLNNIAFYGLYLVYGYGVGAVYPDKIGSGEFIRYIGQGFVYNIFVYGRHHFYIVLQAFDKKDVVEVDFHHFFIYL